MQKTLLSYAEAHDELTGSSILKEFMDGFDENNDGIIDYDENGRKGFWTPGFRILNRSYDIMLTEEYGQLEGLFILLPISVSSLPVKAGILTGMISGRSMRS